MNFPDPTLNIVLSVVLLLALVGVGVVWGRAGQEGNHWAYASLLVALLGAFPMAGQMTLLGALSPLMRTIGPRAATLAMLLGTLAWGLSIVALLARNNWRPAREIGGITPAYLGAIIGVTTVAIGIWQMLRG